MRTLLLAAAAAVVLLTAVAVAIALPNACGKPLLTYCQTNRRRAMRAIIVSSLGLLVTSAFELFITVLFRASV